MISKKGGLILEENQKFIIKKLFERISKLKKLNNRKIFTIGGSNTLLLIILMMGCNKIRKKF